jgi:cytoskeletal protein RodZ
MLIHARAVAGMSVEEVSARTRIRAALIRRMEEDDFSAVGGAVYARGHIRGIARILGVDPEPIVAAYDGSVGEPVPMPAFAPAGPFDPLRRRTTRGPGRWRLAMIVSLVVICLLALYPLLHPSGPSAHGAMPAPSAPVAKPKPPAAPALAPTTAPPTGVSVRLTATVAPSWLRVSDQTSRVLYESILAAGASQTLTGAALTVRIGNAGATRLTCNGRDLGTLGADGQVVTVNLALGASGACAVGGQAR